MEFLRIFFRPIPVIMLLNFGSSEQGTALGERSGNAFTYPLVGLTVIRTQFLQSNNFVGMQIPIEVQVPPKTPIR